MFPETAQLSRPFLRICGLLNASIRREGRKSLEHALPEAVEPQFDGHLLSGGGIPDVERLDDIRRRLFDVRLHSFVPADAVVAANVPELTKTCKHTKV
jgi:hypothetical protein